MSNERQPSATTWATILGLCAALAACGGGNGGGNIGTSAGTAPLAAIDNEDGAEARNVEALAAQTWTQCATEGGTCNFTGSRPVRYGTATTYVTRLLNGPVACTSAVFGDPAPGLVKTCRVGSTVRGDAPVPPPPPPPPPAPSGPVYHFSDCQTGAQPGCIPGNNANPGTAAAPKQTLAGINVNTVPAGTRLLFAQGGAWNNFNVQLLNPNATREQPLVFDSYATAWGNGTRPWLRAGGAFYGFQFGTFGDTSLDGGYTIRNLKVDGVNHPVGSWGIHLRNNVHDVLLENLEITNFAIGVHGGAVIERMTLRNSEIHRNSEMGMLLHADDMLIEGNRFHTNNFSGSAFNHGIYLSGHGRNGIVRNNQFINNSTVNGVCTGGNFTVHGQWDGLLVEGNTISQDASNGGCYGISINSSYDTAEWFRRLVVRGNVLSNVGGCSICLTSAPGALVENNLITFTQNTYQAGILIPDRDPGPGDDVDGGAVIRNNTIYLQRPSAWSEGIALRANAGSGMQVTSNLVYFGAGAAAQQRCFNHGPRTVFTTFDNNLCHHANGTGAWSNLYATLTAARAAGFDANGLIADPLFVAMPAAANGWNDLLRAGSPAIDAGHPTLSSHVDRLGAARTVPNIGSRE